MNQSKTYSIIFWLGQTTDSITELKVIFGHIWFDIYV